MKGIINFRLWKKTIEALYKMDPPDQHEDLILSNNNLTVYLVKIGSQSATTFNLKCT